MTSYEFLAADLTPEAEALFNDMVGAHLAASGMGGRTFTYIEPLERLHFDFEQFFPNREVDAGALRDLEGLGLVRLVRAKNRSVDYDIGGAGVRFHSWLRQQRGQAVDLAEEAVRRLIDGPEFARRHSTAAPHLREAFELLWTDRTDIPAVRELGTHLRSALIDVVLDVTGQPVSDPERIDKQLEAWLVDRETEREVVALAALATAAQRLNQRLDHVTDEERGKGQPAVTWDEMGTPGSASGVSCRPRTLLRSWRALPQ